MIKTDNLTKYYGDFCALKDLSISIDKGRIFGYIGPNGAGKTTTIRILAALMKPSSGRAWIGDVEVSNDARAAKDLVGYLPDFFGVYEGMRVREYLDFFGAAFKIPRGERQKRISRVLDITGSTYMEDMFVEALSRGMKQRVGIARTLLHDPEVLLLDEPLSGLDPNARIEMKELLRRLGKLGKTILVSSHILPELASICDVVGILDHGEIHAFGPVDELMDGIREDRLVELTVLDDARDAGRVLEKASEKAPISNIEIDGRTVRFTWGASEKQLSKLLSYLLQKDLRVHTFREVPISLEEAFIELTGNVPDEEQ
ncbi:MAG: ATP-binding cassette domain-containing protein, partial [Planctomycetota bacterium]